MPRRPFRIALFFSSYVPLFCLLAYANRGSAAAWKTLAAVAVVSSVGLLVVMFANLREQGPRLHVKHSQPQDGDVLAYIATYLIPFFGVDLTDTNDVVLFVGFLTVLMVIYINSNMLLVNPLLTIVGYHTFQITDADGHAYTVITRRKAFEPDETIRPAQITRYLRLEVRHDR